MHKPKLLLLDEPTSGLDPLNQQIFYKLMSDVKRNGAAIFLSTHLLVEAQNICDRVGIIKEDKLLSIENIDDFRQKNICEIRLETKTNILLSDLKIPGVQKIEKKTYGYHLIAIGPNGQIIKNFPNQIFLTLRFLNHRLRKFSCASTSDALASSQTLT